MNLDAPITQEGFGELVGISQQTVSDLVRRGLLLPGAPAGEWLLAYCGNLREVAAGRGGERAVELAEERALLAREQRTKLAMQNAVTRRELAPVRLIEEVLARAGTRAAKILDTITPELRRRAPALASADLEAVAAIVAKARNMAARISLADLDIEADAEHANDADAPAGAEPVTEGDGDPSP